MPLFSCGVHLFSENETLKAPEFSVDRKGLPDVLGEKGRLEMQNSLH